MCSETVGSGEAACVAESTSSLSSGAACEAMAGRVQVYCCVQWNIYVCVDGLRPEPIGTESELAGSDQTARAAKMYPLSGVVALAKLKTLDRMQRPDRHRHLTGTQETEPEEKENGGCRGTKRIYFARSRADRYRPRPPQQIAENESFTAALEGGS